MKLEPSKHLFQARSLICPFGDRVLGRQASTVLAGQVQGIKEA